MDSNSRRAFMFNLALSPLVFTGFARAVEEQARLSPQDRIAMLEKGMGGRLGVYALNTDNGRVISHRGDERFSMCSTFKVILSAAMLEKSTNTDGLLQRRIHYPQGELVSYSPITEKHLRDGMSISELCAAALQYSDNSAGNLLMKALGGPATVTAYARSIGNSEFRLDRWETELNS